MLGPTHLHTRWGRPPYVSVVSIWGPAGSMLDGRIPKELSPTNTRNAPCKATMGRADTSNSNGLGAPCGLHNSSGIICTTDLPPAKRNVSRTAEANSVSCPSDKSCHAGSAMVKQKELSDFKRQKSIREAAYPPQPTDSIPADADHRFGSSLDAIQDSIPADAPWPPAASQVTPHGTSKGGFALSLRSFVSAEATWLGTGHTLPEAGMGAACERVEAVRCAQ